MKSPKYDNVLVNLGAFHIFHCNRKVYCQVWGPHLLNQARILEKGSLKRFITGKVKSLQKNSSNTCCCYEHFREFESGFNNGSLSVVNEELKFIKEEGKISGYLLFSRDTLEGKYGLTAQYWMGYIEMLHLYHEFS